MTDIPSIRQRILPIVLRAVFAGSAMWILFRFVDPDQVWSSIKRADVIWLGGAFLLIPAHLAVRTLRWHILLRAVGLMFPVGYTARVVLAGYAFSAVTPGEVGDFFVRSRFHDGTGRGTIPALVLVDKIVQIVVTMVMGVPALTFVLFRSWTLAIILLLFFAGMVSGLAAKRRWLLERTLVRRWADRLRLHAGLQVLTQVPRSAVIFVVLLAGLMLVVYALQEACLLNAVGTVSIGVAWLGYFSSMLLQMVLPFSIAGLGVREGSHVYFFGLLGVPAVTALSASLLMMTINILLPSILGLIVFMFLPKRSSTPS